MHGDFTRDSFEPQKAYSRVMMPQGRVLLDADWNEQTSLTLGYVRRLARDLLGRGAGPEGECGFRIATKAHLRAVNAAGPDPFPADERAAIQTNKAALNSHDLLLLPGLYYVAGIPVGLAEPMLYSKQRGFDDATWPRLPAEVDSSWFAYLEVWEEFVSPEQDPGLREPALGDADTCGRAVVRWQVRLLFDGTSSVEELEARGSGTLTAWTKPGEKPETPCIIPPDAKYRGRENQLYRVEIHKSSDSAGEGATFTWSRDNGSQVYRVRDIDDKLVRLDHLGRDQHSELAVDDWVELVDDFWTGRDPAGPLARVSDVKRDERAVILDWAKPDPSLPPISTFADGLHPILRRWNHRGDVNAAGGAIPIDESGEIELEDGIFIRFEQGKPYRSGDHWLIPARVASNDIMWPRLPGSPGGPGAPAPRPPHGPARFYAPLALVDNGVFNDRRSCFEPISKLVS